MQWLWVPSRFSWRDNSKKGKLGVHGCSQHSSIRIRLLLFIYWLFIKIYYNIKNLNKKIMETKAKNLKLRWRCFIISALVLIILSIIAVSRTLGNSIIDEISICSPFFTLYYILIGLHVLSRYEEEAVDVGEKRWLFFVFKKTKPLKRLVYLSVFLYLKYI